MPTYQYACTACDHRFEAVQSFSDDALTVCPSCEGALRKVFSAVGVVFKGSGFYRNDSRSGAKATNGAAAPASSGSEKSTTSSGSSDAGGSSSSEKATSSSSPAPASGSTAAPAAKASSSSSGAGSAA